MPKPHTQNVLFLGNLTTPAWYGNNPPTAFLIQTFCTLAHSFCSFTVSSTVCPIVLLMPPSSQQGDCVLQASSPYQIPLPLYIQVAATPRVQTPCLLPICPVWWTSSGLAKGRCCHLVGSTSLSPVRSVPLPTLEMGPRGTCV